jgi:N-acetyl-gamma-glutamyl-phosphate reductase/acetylglutamate kinase
LFGNLELYSRSELREARKITNPGCYATGIQLLTAPLLDHVPDTSRPTVFGISGYSGAGTKSGSKAQQRGSPGPPATEPKVSPESLGGGVRSYSLTDHIHEREASHHLSRLRPLSKVAFIPVIAPWFSGILLTASVPLRAPLRAAEVKALYEKRYGGEKLVRIQKAVPELGDVQGKHGFALGPCQVSSAGDRVVVVVRALPPLTCLRADHEHIF